MAPDDFNRMLLSAVEESLSTLGESPKRAIFFHLETSFKLKKENIPFNLTEFINALERIFGPGASYIQKLIAKRLCEKLGLNYEETEHLNLLDYVDRMEKLMASEEET